MKARWLVLMFVLVLGSDALMANCSCGTTPCEGVPFREPVAVSDERAQTTHVTFEESTADAGLVGGVLLAFILGLPLLTLRQLLRRPTAFLSVFAAPHPQTDIPLCGASSSSSNSSNVSSSPDRPSKSIKSSSPS